MSMRDRVEDSMARQSEWGTDNPGYFIDSEGNTSDMRNWGDDQWKDFEALYEPNNESTEDLMSTMDMDLSRLNNYK